MVVLACDLSTWEAEARGAWSVARLGNKQAKQLSQETGWAIEERR